MDLVIYLNCKVYVTLNNSYYYEGVVLEADADSLTILDKRGKRVSLTKNAILTIREVSK